MNVTVNIDKIDKARVFGYAEFWFEATLSYGSIHKSPKKVVGVRCRTPHGDASVFRYYVSRREIKVEPLVDLINEALDKAVA